MLMAPPIGLHLLLSESNCLQSFRDRLDVAFLSGKVPGSINHCLVSMQNFLLSDFSIHSCLTWSCHTATVRQNVNI